MNLKSRLLIALGLLSLISGCAISPERISSQSDLDVCQSYGIYSRGIGWGELADQYKKEIFRRNLLTQEEWELAAQKRIRRGMGQCAMYVSWGKPDRENRSVGSWGVHIQHVYNAGYKYIPVSYVYTENGKVTSWQD